MKSLIDWNELIPKLPKKVRDDLYLEAVTYLSEGGKSREPKVEEKREKKSAKRRIWGLSGEGRHLAVPGRKYKINKNRNLTFRGDVSGPRELWQKLRDSHNEIITYEGIASICKGIKNRNGD